MENILFDFISKYVSLTEDEKNALLSPDLFHSVKKGIVLLNEGQKSKYSYFILKSCIRSYYIFDGEEKTTAFYTEMEAEETKLTFSSSHMKAEINSKFPKFEIICRKLSEELLAKQQIDFDEFKTSSPEQQYLNLIQKRQALFSVCHNTN